MLSPELEAQWRWVKPAWRVIVAVVLAELVGGGAGLMLGLHPHPTIAFWFGALAAASIGVLVGLAWQGLSAPQTFITHPGPLAAVSLLGPGLAVGGYLARDHFAGFGM